MPSDEQPSVIDAPEPVRQGVTRQRSPLWLRRGGVALAVTIAALVATCTDHPTEPLMRGGRVLLAVRPLLQSPVKLQAFGLTISPAEFDKDAWATPRAMVADIERRVAGANAA